MSIITCNDDASLCLSVSFGHIKNGCPTVKTHPHQENDMRHRMSETHALPDYYDGSGLYEIRLKGHLESRWADRFDGLTITLEENGDTLLSGPVADQAALHGLLKSA
jgi:hypothetical protein